MCFLNGNAAERWKEQCKIDISDITLLKSSSMLGEYIEWIGSQVAWTEPCQCKGLSTIPLLQELPEDLLQSDSTCQEMLWPKGTAAAEKEMEKSHQIPSPPPQSPEALPTHARLLEANTMNYL